MRKTNDLGDKPLAQDEQTLLLREMRDLLRVMAEPALAKRDEKFRSALLDIVGKGKAKAKAVLLMDGARSQKTISGEADIDTGQLSRLVKELRDKGLLLANEKVPKLVISIPPNFFESRDKKNG